MKRALTGGDFTKESVTPCVGVWIETCTCWILSSVRVSHPAWVCGLKPLKREDIMLLFVTPCVGVWIETYWEMISDLENGVTPCVGVWIETMTTQSIIILT